MVFFLNLLKKFMGYETGLDLCVCDGFVKFVLP